MKPTKRNVRKLLTGSLLIISALFLLLMVIEMFDTHSMAAFHSAGNAATVKPLEGMRDTHLLNCGSADALDELPGIGEVLAMRIIEAREADGPFFFPQDLMTVSGIGEKKYLAIFEYLERQPATWADISMD